MWVMENSDFSFFPDLSTLSLICASENDPELTELLNTFEGIPRIPLSDIKNSPRKKPKLRFAPPIDSQQVASASTPFVPKNTAQQTQWSVKVFNDWASHRNSQVTDAAEKVPDNFLNRIECATSAQMLNTWLIRFVLEGTRKQDGSFYPAETVCVGYIVTL